MNTFQRAPRLWEVDTLRGIAVLLMIFYHFIWDLTYFQLYQADMLSGPWYIFARGIGSTFIFLLGVSLTLDFARHQAALQNVARFGARYRRYLLRGARIFCLGMLVTIASYVFVGQGFVLFGILHLLGSAIMLAYPFLFQRPWVSVLVGLTIIGGGVYLSSLRVPFPWLIWLGISQQGLYMSDYYPLVPWFGVVLVGIFAGYTLYPQGVCRFALPDCSNMAAIRLLSYLGRHSLVIYLTHQPILIALLLGLGFGSL